MEVIKDGDVVVIQRDKYMRVQKISVGANKNCVIHLGKEQVEMTAIVGQRYGSIFKMVPHEKKKKMWNLEYVEETVDFETVFMSDKSGEDNRNLLDTNKEVQGLSREDIEAMKEECTDGQEIVGQLIENSASFHQKTKYSQAKFLKKKSKKYCQFLVIKKPSIRLIMQINYTSDPMKMMNMRIDTLAQVLNNANVRSGGNYMVYETGCQGVVVASCLERLGQAGKIVHIYQTGSPQTQSLNSMNFSVEKQREFISTINIYHLRALEQGKVITHMHENNATSENGAKPFRQKQREESIKSFDMLKSRKMDGLIIVAKQHPKNILLALVKYLSYSRPFVVYSPYKEPLLEAYVAIKETGQAVMVTLSESWLRNYQVLPDRSHPEVLMSGGGGYLLSGTFVDNSSPEEVNGHQSKKLKTEEK